MGMEELKGFTKEQINNIDQIIDKHKKNRGELIPMLEELQALLGYMPVSLQERISEKTGIPSNTIYGVVSFYSFFTMEPRGRHRVQVCLGTACYVKGGKEIADKIEKELNIKSGESTKDGRFTYETTRCFGACGLGPVIVVDGKVYGKVELDKVMDILNEYK